MVRKIVILALVFRRATTKLRGRKSQEPFENIGLAYVFERQPNGAWTEPPNSPALILRREINLVAQ